MPTITALPAGTTIAGTEPLPVVQSGATVKTTPAALKTYIAPLTTKGDLLTFSTVPFKLAVGTNGYVLSADSSATGGVSWKNLVPLATKGDLLAFTTVPVALGVGADGTVLTSSSGAASGVAWENPSNVRPVRGIVQLGTGTALVSTSQVTTNSLIFLTVQTIGTVTAPQALSANTIIGGTSFVITSADASDTSHVAWAVFEPNVTP